RPRGNHADVTADPLHPLEHLLQVDGRALRGLARSLVAPSDADDVVQDAMAAALVASVRPRHDGRAWLRGVVRRLAALYHRSEARRGGREAAVARGSIAPPEACDPALLAADAEMLAAVGEAVRGLDEPYRSVIVLRFWHGHSAEEVARQLGLPQNTVRSQL